jgi:hypothetical protein
MSPQRGTAKSMEAIILCKLLDQSLNPVIRRFELVRRRLQERNAILHPGLFMTVGAESRNPTESRRLHHR